MWRSSVARFVRDEEAVGSNPIIPTSKPIERWFFLFLYKRMGYEMHTVYIIKSLKTDKYYTGQSAQCHPGKLAGGKFIRDLNNTVAF